MEFAVYLAVLEGLVVEQANELCAEGAWVRERSGRQRDGRGVGGGAPR